jgi:hypothetical protein
MLRRNQSALEQRATETLLASHQKSEESKRIAHEQERAERTTQAEWNSLWQGVTGEYLGPMIQWTDDCIPAVRKLAKRLNDDGQMPRVDRIIQRIENWLPTVDEPRHFVKPVSIETGTDSKHSDYVETVRAVLACAIVLKSSARRKRNLVPPGILIEWLSSHHWENFAHEFHHGNDGPIEPYFPQGHCLFCNESYDMVSMPRFNGYCLSCNDKHLSEGCGLVRVDDLKRLSTSPAGQDSEVYREEQRTNEARLVHAASEANLCRIDDDPQSVAESVIRWGVGISQLSRASVERWSIDEAIERLNDAASGIRSDTKQQLQRAEERTETPQELEPGEATLADAAESSLSGVPLRLFRRLRQNQRFVSFDTLRADVWGGKMIKDRGIEAAIERLNTALLDTRFAVEKNENRAKLTGI